MMDTRIEVLTEVVCDYAKGKADLLYEAQGRDRGYKYHAYRRIENLCIEIFDVLEQYRQNHPEEYDPVKRTNKARV